MFEMIYYDMYKQSKEHVSIRKEIISTAKKVGASKTAEKYRMSRNTVSKW